MSRLQEIKDYLETTSLPEKKKQDIIDELLSKYNVEEFKSWEMPLLFAEIDSIEKIREAIKRRLAYAKELREDIQKKRER